MNLQILKISNQIRITQLIVFISIMVMGIFSYFTMNGLIKKSETLRNHPVVTQRALSSIKEDILSIRLLMEEIVSQNAETAIQMHMETLYSYEADAVKQLDALAVSYLGPKSDLATLKNQIIAYQATRKETLRLLKVGELAEAKLRVLANGVGGVQAKEIIISIGIMEDFAENKASELYLDSNKMGNRSLVLDIIIFVAVLFMTSMILTLLKKNIMVPLDELGNDISGFEQGKIADRSMKVSKNEISMLSNTFNLMMIEKEKRAAELVIANKELLIQNEEKVKRAAELIAAKTEISSQAAHIIMQKAYYLDKQLYQATLLSIGDAVISCDVESNIIFINKVAETLTGYKQEEAIGQPVENILNIANEVTHEKCDNIVKQVIITKSTVELGLHTVLINRYGSEKPIEDSAAPIFNENGELAGAVLVFRDVTEKREAIRDIEYLGYHDKLTGLYNRRFYEEEINRLDTRRNLPLTIIMGDANGLKLINDSFGHPTGDVLLQKAARAIRNGCRTDDIIARLGGDEFIAVFPNTDKPEAELIIRRIQNHLRNDAINDIPITISFGHGTKEYMDQDIKEIFKHAEDDMYKQKLYESSSVRSRTVDIIMNTLYEKNMREMHHSKRVGESCEALALKMHFGYEDTNKIRLAGLMHDIGKIAIDDGILNKIGKITKKEFDEIKRHSGIGYRILSSVHEFSDIANFVLEHHERWDDQGYPKGLKGSEISIQGRMIGIADAFDAMTSERTYKEKLSVMDAIDEIRMCAGIQFDPDITENFIEVALELSANSTNR